MDKRTQALTRERNLITQSKHDREFALQIILPLLLGGLILLALAFLATIMSPGETSRWADISLIWLIVPVMVMLLISLVTLIITIYAIMKLIQILPFYSFRLQRGMTQLNAVARQLGDYAVEPVLRVGEVSSAFGTLKRVIGQKQLKPPQPGD